MMRRISRREMLGGGAATLISHLLYKEPALKALKQTALHSGGISRVSGTPAVTDYRSPGGLYSPFWNFITVAKDGGDFETITDALDYVQDANATNLYCIFVYPGVYDEQVVMKSYVALVGLDRDVCVITQSDEDITVLMDDFSSLNELRIINEHSAGGYAVVIDTKQYVLIDSCLIEATANSAGASARGISIGNCANTRILGSEILASNPGGGGAYGIFKSRGTAEIRYSRVELWNDFDVGAAIYVNTTTTDSEIKILHCWIRVQNVVGAAQQGIQLVTGIPAADNVAYIEHTSIEHESTLGGGFDLTLADAYCVAYVRADRYSTWNTADVGQILPLAGDRPRLECLHDGTQHTIAAGAGVFENDPTGVVTINVPCQSDLSIVVNCTWSSDTVRDQSFGARVLVDGVLAGGPGAYEGEPDVDNWRRYGLSVCISDVATGNHTVQFQVRRNNAADTITVEERDMVVTSTPWP